MSFCLIAAFLCLLFSVSLFNCSITLLAFSVSLCNRRIPLLALHSPWRILLVLHYFCYLRPIFSSCSSSSLTTWDVSTLRQRGRDTSKQFSPDSLTHLCPEFSLWQVQKLGHSPEAKSFMETGLLESLASHNMDVVQICPCNSREGFSVLSFNIVFIISASKEWFDK